MKTHVRKFAELGDLIAAAFDVAGSRSADPREVSRLAALVVAHMLHRARRSSFSPSRRASRATAAELSQSMEN